MVTGLVLGDALAFCLAVDGVFGLAFDVFLDFFRDAALSSGCVIGLGLLGAAISREGFGLDWGCDAQAKACASIWCTRTHIGFCYFVGGDACVGEISCSLNEHDGTHIVYITSQIWVT